MDIKYPTEQQIIDANEYVLETIRVRKADRHKVLTPERITGAIQLAQNEDGDLYAKAAVLVSSLTKGHAFDSGNRRTAVSVAETFLNSNGENVNLVHNPNVLQGIREGFYTKDEIKQWLKGVEIRPFKRL